MRICDESKQRNEVWILNYRVLITDKQGAVNGIVVVVVVQKGSKDAWMGQQNVQDRDLISGSDKLAKWYSVSALL